MKIAIDCSKAINEKAGVARYTWEISSNLFKLYPNDQFLAYFNYIRGGQNKKQLIDNLVDDNKNVLTKTISLPGGIKERLFTSAFSLSNFWLKNYDIYHATEFLSFDRGLKLPQILTVHDLTMIKFPSHRGANVSQRHGKMLEKACKDADTIISVSEATKNDIIKYFQISPDKIKTIYSGYNTFFKKISDEASIKKILNKYHINSPFILHVGTVEPRKNLVNLIKAFEVFSKTILGRDYKLVLIGKMGWNTDDIINVSKKKSIVDKIIFLNYVPDSDLIAFYNKTSLFCFPSLYEGFGLPLLEAMACGAPVLTSKISSLPEVGGDAAYYVDPNKYEEFSVGMQTILQDKKLIAKMSEMSLTQAAKFSWASAAKQTHQVYESVIKAKDKNEK